MRILFCNKYNYRFSGTENYLFDVMELLRQQGHETALFSMADQRGAPTSFDRYFVPHIDFKRDDLSLPRRARLAAHTVYSIGARRRIRRLIEEFRPDVAHVRNIYHHLSPSILWQLRAHKVPVVYHINDFKLLCPSYNAVSKGEACERCRGGRFWHTVTENCYGQTSASLLLAAEAYAQRILRTYQKCVDVFLAPSEFVRSKWIGAGFDPGRIRLLPHFQSVAETTGRPRDSVLYFGRLSREKGVADLLLAMRELPYINLSIAGAGPELPALQRLAVSFSLKNVWFRGHLGDHALARAIADSRFTVFPSHAYETFGKSIVESYAHARAVIASDLGSRRELVEDGKTGLLFPPGNVSALRDAIAFLHAEKPVSVSMGQAAQDLVRTRYAPERHLEALTGIYRDLAHDNQPNTHRPRVKVAFIGGRGVISKYSGIEAYYEEVGKELASRGHDVTIYCRPYFTPPVKQHAGMKLVRIPTVRTKHLETFMHTLLSSLHVLFTRNRIVHYHALGPSLFSFLPHLAGKKTVVTVQGLDWQRKKWNALASAVLRAGEHASATLPDATMVVSETLRRYYQDRHGRSAVCVPNGTHLRERRPASRLSDWGLEPEQYILFLGRFSPEKNCHLLVDAYERIDTSVKLVFAGGSSYTDRYVDELQQHASDRIRFLPWVGGDELDELLTNAMLFVLPSDMEGLSLALLDAMGAGVCVLTSDIPENRELVEGAGFTFRAGDTNDLEQVLRRLLADPHARREAAQAAKERVRKHYLWPDLARRIEAVYLQLTGEEAA